MKLSAAVITLNEEAKLGDCLASLAFADEIVVVDSGSRDRTRSIAVEHGAKLLERPFEDFSSQKNYAASKTTGEWVLSVDADERVTPALAEEIRRAIETSDADGYEIPRKTRLFGRVFRFSGLQTDRPLRLYKKSAGRFEGAVHERVRVDGKVARLKNALEHISFQTPDEHRRRLDLYTDLEPLGDRKPTVFDLWIRPAYRFFSMYLAKQGFRDGKEGFQYCALSASYEWARWSKLLKKKRGQA